MTDLTLIVAAASVAANPMVPEAATALVAAITASELEAARVTLSEDAVIMKGFDRPVVGSLVDFAGRVRGCAPGEIFTDVDSEDPSRAAVTANWDCPSTRRVQAFIWTVGARVVHIQYD